MSSKKELIKGNVQTVVMKLLSQREMYGYQIIQSLKEKSVGFFDLSEGTLYPILHQLETQKAVESFWTESAEGRKRKFYRLTESGTALLVAKEKEWRGFQNAMDAMLTGTSFQEV